MKYIKTYESDQKYLKVGDKVKYIRNKAMNWIDPETYLIIEIDMPYWKVSNKKLELHEMLEYKIDKLSPDGYRTYETKWVDIHEIIPDYEIISNKFNL